MIDFHTHLLPCVDDGSKSVEESISLLKLLSAQGVDTAFATPHFYAESDSPAAFFERRARAMEELTRATAGMPSLPQLRLGAEVAYYTGLSSSATLLDMRLESTELLLLEMPMNKWSDYTVKELTDLAYTSGIKVLLAHVERYLPYVTPRTLETLRSHGILMQANASSFLGVWHGRASLRLLQEGNVRLVASDCHGLHHRPPVLDRACRAIEKKLGASVLSRMDALARSLLSDKTRAQ